jgi:mono/diheme cytochrome c family protein
MRPTSRIGLSVLAAVLTMGSTVALAQLPFMRNMHTGPVVMPQVDTRAPVDDTIAVDGVRLRDRIESQHLPNPVPNTSESRATGAQMYNVYCTVCHGASGQGDGQIAEHFARMPNLALPYVQDYTDGWIYAIIREGGRSMPPFAHSMSVTERWSLVHYVKTFEVASTQ